MASTEERAYEIMRELDVSYVLVIFGGLTGYSSDGMSKEAFGQKILVLSKLSNLIQVGKLCQPEHIKSSCLAVNSFCLNHFLIACRHC